LASLSGINSDKAFAMADNILQAGLDIDSHDKSLTPLHTAISANDSGAVRYLLSHCADPFTLTNIGDSNDANQVNAFELLDRLGEINLAVDRSDIAHIMSTWKPISDCNGH
jgi:hypothetical protein